MNFCEFTDCYFARKGEKLLINMDYVVSITPVDTDGTCNIWTYGEEENFCVQESFFGSKANVNGSKQGERSL